jgi:hypothetical protein
MRQGRSTERCNRRQRRNCSADQQSYSKSRSNWTNPLRVMRGLDPIGANLSLATNLSVVMPRFKRGTQ